MFIFNENCHNLNIRMRKKLIIFQNKQLFNILKEIKVVIFLDIKE